MKYFLIIMVIFVIGFFSAKYIYQPDNSQAPSTKVLEDIESEAIDAEPESFEEPATPQNETIHTQKVNNEQEANSQQPSSKNLNDGFVSDQTIKDIEKKLQDLDNNIENELNKLKEADPKAAEDLKNKINEKHKGLMPGDDEHTEKEYQ